MSALVKIPSEVEQRVTSLIAMRDMAVTNPEQVATATDARTLIKATVNTLEKQRKALVGPLNDQVKEINAAFKAWTEPLDATDGSIERSLLAWHRKERERIEAEQRRIAEENERARQAAAAEELARMEAAAEAARQEALADGVSAADAEQFAEEAANSTPVVQPVLEAAPVVETSIRGTFGTSTVQMRWVFDVVELSQVPIEYLSLNETAVREAIRRGEREIPGLCIYQTESIARR